MQKDYILDTNILIEDAKSIENLKNGIENRIYITSTTIEELDKLKDKKPQLKGRIFEVLDELEVHKDDVGMLYSNAERNFESQDNRIIEEILYNINGLYKPVFVTNDRILQFKAYKKGIVTEEYKTSIPFKQESEEYTGFVEPYTEEKVNNCFYWDQGKIYFYSNGESEKIYFQYTPWNIEPRNHYQNCLLHLLNKDDIDLVTVQSAAGKGKTFLALAMAFTKLFQKNTGEKPYEKIYVIKSNYEIGNDLGYLPGTVEEKMYPHFKPIQELIGKLNKNRQIPHKYLDEKNVYGMNKQFVEFLPINYLRGMNLENCVVICEEIQNLSRSDARSLLSRMGENVKCICTGDIAQIDNPYLTRSNNAMNWMVKLFKGESNYAHFVLKGKKTRGPICQMVNDKGL